MYFKCNVHQPRRASIEIGILAREFFHLPVSTMLDRASYFTNQCNKVETIDNTIDPAIAGTIPPIWNPGTYQETNIKHSTLIASDDNPNVRNVSGNVRNLSTGRTVLLIKPNNKAAIRAVIKSRSRNCPGKKWSIIRCVIKNAIALSTQLISSLNIGSWGLGVGRVAIEQSWFCDKLSMLRNVKLG